MSARSRKNAAGAGRDSVILLRPHIYILPTRHGWLFGLTLLAMLIGAVNYNSNLGYAFTFLLGSIATVSILHTYRNMAGLSFKAGRAPPTFAGGAAAFEILVTNAAASARYGLLLRADGYLCNPFDIRAQETVPIVLKRRADRRGVQRLDPFTVRTRFPLGLFYGWSWVELDVQCLVYPRPGPPRTPPPDSSYEPDSDGHRGRGTGDFVGFRAYSPGDSPQHVYWKAVARGGEMLVKQFGGGDALEQWFDWEQLPDLDPEARLSQLCRWVLDAHGRRESYGLRLPGAAIPVADGEQHKHRCLEALARF
ncbi:MAG: DUF58 domain-containing protein [Kiritimatiellae bacterium]|nr:DUF58 domain-containing protein [Kiritimatiellia bacterium]